MRAVQGKIDGEQWKEMGAKVEGFRAKAIILASRNSSKVNFGRWQKVRKKVQHVSNIKKINLQKLLRASSPHSKSCFRILAASQKKKKTKRHLRKLTKRWEKTSTVTFKSNLLNRRGISEVLRSSDISSVDRSRKVREETGADKHNAVLGEGRFERF